MKIPQIINAIGYIDDELLSETLNRKKKIIKNKWISLVACICVISVLAVLLLTHSKNKQETGQRYKDFIITEESTAIIWPWKYLSTTEKYTQTEINGIEYSITGGRVLSEKKIGKKIGEFEFWGYDEISGEKYTQNFEVNEIQGVKSERFIAVLIDGKYYCYKNSVYTPLNTLSELYEIADLKSIIELERFSENGDGPDAKHFKLNDDEYIWDIILSCGEASIVTDNWWHPYDREFLSFTITSENIGVYKNAMYITNDGYLWTNMFSFEYIFDIGTEATDKIIKYAMENSETAEYEPYQKSVCGKVTEIKDDYILIDDSSLCKNESDGIIYKVLLNDIRISRYILIGNIKVGQTVEVVYEGVIDEKNSYTIDNAISVNDVDISFENEEDIIEEYDTNSETVYSETVSNEIISNEIEE